MEFFNPELHAADFYTCVGDYYEPASGLPTADMYTFPRVLTCTVLGASDVADADIYFYQLIVGDEKIAGKFVKQ